MKSFIQDIQSGLRNFCASYLTLYLPAALLMSFISLGLFKAEDPDTAFLLAGTIGLIFYTALPAIASARKLKNAGHRLKSFTLLGGDALFVAIAIYLVPKPNIQSTLGLAIATLMGAILFFLISILLRRGLCIAQDIERPTLRAHISFIWKYAPGLLFRMGAGVILTGLGVVTTQAILNFETQFTDLSQTLFLSFALNAIVLIPASFLPFILLAEGLKLPAPEPD